MLLSTSCAKLTSRSIVIGDNEPIVTKEFNVNGDIRQINSPNICDVEYHQGDKQSVVLKCNKALVDHMEVTLRGGVLTIALKEGYDAKNSYSVLRVTAPHVSEFVSEGTGDFEIFDITGPSLSIQSYGTGDFDIRTFTGDTFSATTNGTGDIDADKIQADKISLETYGTGDIEANIEAGNVRAVTAGTGDIKLSGTYGDGTFEASGVGDMEIDNLKRK